MRLLENAVVGVLIAMASFVCSIGNLPLAAALWSGGISFGGVTSFIYADLVIIPLLLIYRKYYGLKATAYITVILASSMVLAGMVVDLLFGALGLVPRVCAPDESADDSHVPMELHYLARSARAGHPGAVRVVSSWKNIRGQNEIRRVEIYSRREPRHAVTHSFNQPTANRKSYGKNRQVG